MFEGHYVFYRGEGKNVLGVLKVVEEFAGASVHAVTVWGVFIGIVVIVSLLVATGGGFGFVIIVYVKIEIGVWVYVVILCRILVFWEGVHLFEVEEFFVEGEFFGEFF